MVINEEKVDLPEQVEESKSNDSKKFSVVVIMAMAIVFMIVGPSIIHFIPAIVSEVVGRVLIPIALVLPVCLAIDQLGGKEFKSNVSGYILKNKNISFVDFEYSVIRSLIGLFIKENGEISALRVLAYSFTGSIFMMASLIGLRQYTEVFGVPPVGGFQPLVMAIAIIALSIIFSYLSVASDYFSIFVTKTIFLKPNRKASFLPFYIILDLFISTIVPFIPLVLLHGFGSLFVDDVMREEQVMTTLAPITIGILVTMYLSALITFLQIMVLIYGLMLRYTFGSALVLLKKYSKFLNIEDSPLAVSMLLCFTIAMPFRVLFILYLD